MTTQRFPEFDPDAIRPALDALHAYARVLGGWLIAYGDDTGHEALAQRWP